MSRRQPGPRVPGTSYARCRGLSVLLGGTTVLDDITLDVRSGELLALVGPNGAGKSTLLAALTGDLRQGVSGHVELDGAPLGSWSPAELAERRAVLLQHNTVAFSFSALDVVRMGRAPWRAAEPGEDDRAVAQALETCQVAHLVHRPVTTLSGGERARVALARVLAQGAPLLLLDEPTAALDPHHQEVVLQVARARARAGDAVVVVLHDLDLAASCADRIAVLSHGRLIADATPAELMQADLLSAVYGHEVEVVVHPRTGRPLVLPVR